MSHELLPPEAVPLRQKFALWNEEHGPFEWIEFDEEDGPNFQRAQGADPTLVWTDYHDEENLVVLNGFHFWSKYEVHGWHIARKPWIFPEGHAEIIQCSWYGHCNCFDEASGSGDPDCEEFGCSGEGFRDYYFE